MNVLRRIIYWLCPPCRPHRSRTVRYAFPLILASLTIFGAATINSLPDGSYVRLELSQEAVAAGDIFWVDVYAHSPEAVNAVEIKLAYPDEKVEVTGIDVGESVITLWTQDPYVENGRVILRGGTYRRGFKGEHLIATVNFQARHGGVANFETSEIVFFKGDGSGEQIAQTSGDDGTVNLYVDTEPQAGTNGIAADVEFVIVTDIDGDGNVSFGDIRAFMRAWFGAGERQYDFNNDGEMSFRDFSIILADSFFK